MNDYHVQQAEDEYKKEQSNRLFRYAASLVVAGWSRREAIAKVQEIHLNQVDAQATVGAVAETDTTLDFLTEGSEPPATPTERARITQVDAIAGELRVKYGPAAFVI